MSLGLSLSGGGSRAAAFHCGTLAALEHVGMLKDVDVLSTVSGGSVLGAAWLVAGDPAGPVAPFIDHARAELAKGFVERSLLSRNAFKLPFPGYHRTDLFADTFDRAFFCGKTLQQLPAKPALCLNTTVLNTGQAGLFSGTDFITFARSLAGKQVIELTASMPSYRLAKAVAASAAFPIGLCPMELVIGKDITERDWGDGTQVEGLDSLKLTDGGVLENLGVQTLLKRKGLSCWDLIISDAGTAYKAWKPGLGATFQSGFMGWISSGTSRQVNELMHGKKARHMRHETMQALELSWLAGAARSPAPVTPAMNEYFLEEFPSPPAPQAPHFTRRKLLMVRLDQTWDDFLMCVPAWRLVELGAPSIQARQWTRQKNARAIEAFLDGPNGRLQAASQVYLTALGGDKGAALANSISTNFTALCASQLAALYHQAFWQVLALKAVYW